MGEPDPFKLAKRLPRKAFIYWKARRELKLTNLHEKWEYYVAALRQDIGAAFGVERDIKELLIELEMKTEGEARQEQERKNEAFMSALFGAAELIKRKENG